MTRSNILAYSRARRISEAEATGRPVVGERDRAAGDELAELGQLLALAPLAHGPDRIDVGLPRPLGLEDDELGGPLAVDRRDGVGHAGDRGHARRRGPPRRRWRSSRLPRCPARAGGRGVDQAGADDQAAGVDDDLGLLVPLADGQDACPGSARGRAIWSMSWLGSMIRPPVIWIVRTAVSPRRRGRRSDDGSRRPGTLRRRSFPLHEVEDGHPDGQAVGDLVEDGRVRAVGDLGGQLDAAVDRPGGQQAGGRPWPRSIRSRVIP